MLALFVTHHEAPVSRMFSLIRVFTAAFALCAAVYAQPTFTKIFNGLLGFDDMATIDGPFGTRALYTFTG